MEVYGGGGVLITDRAFVIGSFGNIGVGTVGPSYDVHIQKSSPTETALTIENTNTSSTSVAMYRLLNDTGNGLIAFLNSSNRSADGGVNNATIRNDIGDLHIQGSSQSGLTVVGTTGDALFSSSSTHIGIAAPSLSAAGQGKIYFDSTSNTFQVSENGGAYVPLVTTPGTTKISSLAAGDATNSIDNVNFTQGWTWSNLGVNPGLNLSASNITGGTVVNITAVPNTESALTLSSGNLTLTNGSIEVRGGSNNSLAFFDSSNTFSTRFRAGAPTASVTYLLPPTDGTTGQALTTDGSGNLSWSTASVVLPTARIGFGSATNTITSEADFNYDSINNRLGIGITTPQFQIDTEEDVRFNGVRVGHGVDDETETLVVGEGSLTASGGFRNLAIGNSALVNTTGTKNIAVGTYSGGATTGQSNITIGYESGSSIGTGNNNIVMGESAMLGVSNTSGNIVMGTLVMQNASNTSSNNVFIGQNSIAAGGSGAYTAVNNVALGAGTVGNGMTNLSNTMFLGANAVAGAGNLTYAAAIGAGTTVTQNNSIVIGRALLDQVGIGVPAPQATLDVGGTGAMKVPVGTTAQRPSAPITGMIRFNTTTNKFEGYTGLAWTDFH